MFSAAASSDFSDEIEVIEVDYQGLLDSCMHYNTEAECNEIILSEVQ